MKTKITLDSWLKFHLHESDVLEALLLDRSKDRPGDQVSGLKSEIRLFAKTLKQEKNASQLRGIILTGKQGCGKHAAAYALVKYWLEYSTDIKTLFLSGAELGDQAETFYEISDRLQALLKAGWEDEAASDGLCLILEEPEECGYGKRLFRHLANLLYYAKNYDDKLLLLVLIAEKEPMLPPELEEQLLRLRAALPRAEYRRNYLRELLKGVQFETITAEQTDPLELLVERTEGFDYRTLDLLAGELKREASDAPVSEALLRWTAEQYKAPPPEREQLEVHLKGLEGLQLQAAQPAAPAQRSRIDSRTALSSRSTADRKKQYQKQIDEAADAAVSLKVADLFGGEEVIKSYTSITEFARNDKNFALTAAPDVTMHTEIILQ